MNLEQASVLIESSISGLKVDPIACRGDKPGQWNLTYKGATIWIDVFNFTTAPERYYFQVMSPLTAVPDKNVEDYYKNLLEINHNLYGTWITKKDNWLYMMCLRETDGLDQSEVDATLDRVAHYCADYKGKLTFKFEGSWNPVSVNPGNTSDGPGPVSGS